MGRTEDVRFSPDHKRLAVACIIRNRVTLFDVDVAGVDGSMRVDLTNCVDLSSPALHGPHGLDFIDDETLIVANREGDVAIFKLPACRIDTPSCELQPISLWPAGRTGLLKNPGSIAVSNLDRDHCEILICCNSSNILTRHVLDSGSRYDTRSDEVLVRKWLDVPDGVSVSPDRRWIAVSNHNTHTVLLYNSTPSLNEHSDPDGMLRGVCYPHGLRFSSDGDCIFVADAGAPYVHVFSRDDTEWRGVRYPVAKIKVMNESLFANGPYSSEELGPKGLDIDFSSGVMVITREGCPLGFFDISAILKHASGWNAFSNSHRARLYGAIHDRTDEQTPELSQHALCALDVKHELNIIAGHDLERTASRRHLPSRLSSHDDADRGLEAKDNYIVGDWIVFAAGKGGDIYLGKGWCSVAEPWGRWSTELWGRWDEGSEAEIILHPSTGGSTHLEMETIAFVTASHPFQTVSIVVNGQELKTLSFDVSTARQDHRIALPSDLPRDTRRVAVVFRIANPRSPREAGHGADDRKIGIGLLRLRLV
jgi:hypothetical protein